MLGTYSYLQDAVWAAACRRGGRPEVSSNRETPGPRFPYLQKETTVPETGYGDDVRPAPPRVQPRGGEEGVGEGRGVGL